MTVMDCPEVAGIVRPRSWTIALPAGLTLMNSNQRLHHHQRHGLTKVLRTAGWTAARNAKIPHLEHAYAVGILCPPDRGRRDPANWYPSFKALVDGCVDAGVLEDDDSTRLLGPDMRIGPVVKKSRLILVITDLAGMDPAHLALLNPPGDAPCP